jgi:hypothetical protein
MEGMIWKKDDGRGSPFLSSSQNMKFYTYVLLGV